MSNALLLRRLYRSLLKASEPFSHPTPEAAIYSCLLHRTGIDDGLDWTRTNPLPKHLSLEAIREEDTPHRRPAKTLEEARDLTKSYAEDLDDRDDEDEDEDEDDLDDDLDDDDDYYDLDDDDDDDDDDEDDRIDRLSNELDERKQPSRVLFRRLLRETVTGSNDGQRLMQFPSQVDTKQLRRIIMREFRNDDSVFDVETRTTVAFTALRELNKKLSRIGLLKNDDNQYSDLSDHLQKSRNAEQAAKDVSPLPMDSPDAYLKPGTFLLAHPLLTGYFRRTVICILDHSSSDAERGGTYGLIVNRLGVDPMTGEKQTMTDVLRNVPPHLSESFGECIIRDGGPVHMSLQMIHSTTNTDLGGTVLEDEQLRVDDDPSIAREDPPNASSRSIYYQGDIAEAAKAMKVGELSRDDVAFYVGASCWEVGQLENEIDNGFWIPCQGPPGIALSGTCERVGLAARATPGELWLSMMSAMGEEEAHLANLVDGDQWLDTGSEPCDAR